MDLSTADSNSYIQDNRSLQFKRERRKTRKVIVERLRRERIDRCLDQLKQWLQDSTLTAQVENCNLEKADILELTVTQLRRMVSGTEMQCVSGYSACVQEVNDFLLGIRYDDTTRRHIIQHLCRRRPNLVPRASTSRRQPLAVTGSSLRVPADAESTSGVINSDTDHLRMFSYGSADSTTDGAIEPCDGDLQAAVINDVTIGTSYILESTSSDRTATWLHQRTQSITSTDIVTMDTETREIDPDDIVSQVDDSVTLSYVWRPW